MLTCSRYAIKQFRRGSILPTFRLLLIAALAVAVGSFTQYSQALGVDLENGSITFSLRQEPPNLDSSISADTTSGHMLRLMNEGLVRVSERGKILPGVAKSWQMDVMQVTFELRDDAKWADGKPVVAGDFVYAWRRLVDPTTGARGSTLFAHLIRNANEIMAGELPPEKLAVTAPDDYTLKVTLSHPAPYFLSVVSGTPYFPLRKDFVERQGERYAADAENLLSNGPFVVDEWIHGSKLKFSRNPHYWNQAELSLDALNVGYITADVRSLLNLYKSKELAVLELDEETLKDASRNDLPIRKARRNCIAWLALNMREDRLTHDQRVREAVRLAVDREGFVNRIVALPGTRKIDSPFTRELRGARTSFQREHPAETIDYDVQRARELIAEVRADRGELPPLVLLANETRQIEAEFIQGELINRLGLDVRVDKQTFKQSIAKMRAGDFDLTRVGFCGGVVTDPVVYANVFESTSPFNDVGYANPEYDALLQETRSTIDQVKRMAAFDAMQKLLYQDIPLIPTHQYSYVYLQDQRVAGLKRYPQVDFSRGYIE